MNCKQRFHFVKLNTQPVRWLKREEPHFHSRFQHVSDVHQFAWCDLLHKISPYLSVSILWHLWQFVFNKELISPIQICYILSLIHTTASGQFSFLLIRTSSIRRAQQNGTRISFTWRQTLSHPPKYLTVLRCLHIYTLTEGYAQEEPLQNYGFHKNPSNLNRTSSTTARLKKWAGQMSEWDTD